jgi:Mg/Co/Ni transporter MgtE
MKDDQDFKTQRRRIYRRMGVGSGLGGSIFFAGGLGLAWFGDNMNPVAGLGVLVLATIGVVIGALLGTLTKPKKQEQKNK